MRNTSLDLSLGALELADVLTVLLHEILELLVVLLAEGVVVARDVLQRLDFALHVLLALIPVAVLKLRF